MCNVLVGLFAAPHAHLTPSPHLAPSPLLSQIIDLPDFTVVSATIGHLSAAIPWRTLMISQATIEVSDITIILAPKSPDREEEKKRRREKKQER